MAMVRFRSGKAHSKNKGLRTFKPSKTPVPTGTHSLEITSLADDGRGIGRLGDHKKPVFVRAALPGEKVDIRFITSRNKYAEAELLAVNQSSPDRTAPECPLYLCCGGCSLQHLAYEQQLAHKQQRLVQLLGRLDAEAKVAGPLTSKPYHYRHRARLAVSGKGKRLDIGFRQAESHQIVAVDYCPILQPGLNTLLQWLKPTLQSLSKAVDINEILISEDDNQRLGLLLKTRKILPRGDIALLADFASEHQLYIEQQDKVAERWQSEAGQSDFNYKLTNDDQALNFNLTDFTQVNPAINRQLITRALDWLELNQSDHVADFFCGIGNFTLPIAIQASSVIGFELAQEMVEKAQLNAEMNTVDNTAFYCRDLMSEGVTVQQRFNKALLDPPRAGAYQLCRYLATVKPARIVYISCNPQTLVRDAEPLLASGYRLEQYALADMFPQTHHSEAIALFTLQG